MNTPNTHSNSNLNENMNCFLTLFFLSSKIAISREICRSVEINQSTKYNLYKTLSLCKTQGNRDWTIAEKLIFTPILPLVAGHNIVEERSFD